MDKKLINKIPKRVEAAVSDNKARLYLHGTVGIAYDGFGFETVKNALIDVKADTIEVHLNSYGGDMFEGIAIKNYLSQRSENIRVVIDGIAASAASVIAMAGDEILMPKDTQLMIHNPWTWAAGNSKELRKVADDLDKAAVSIEESYLKRFVGEREELKTLLDEESYLTADEAVALGLADAVFDEEETEEKLGDEPINKTAALLAKYSESKTAASVADVTDTKSSNDGLVKFMKLFK